MKIILPQVNRTVQINTSEAPISSIITHLCLGLIMTMQYVILVTISLYKNVQKQIYSNRLLQVAHQVIVYTSLGTYINRQNIKFFILYVLLMISASIVCDLTFNSKRASHTICCKLVTIPKIFWSYYTFVYTF